MVHDSFRSGYIFLSRTKDNLGNTENVTPKLPSSSLNEEARKLFGFDGPNVSVNKP